VVFDPDCKVPHTSKDTIYIPQPSIDITQDDCLRLRQAVLHESLHHIKGPEIFNISEENALKPMAEGLGTLLNVFEDSRIEREGSRDFLGDKEILVDGKGLFYRDFKDSKLKELDPKDKDQTMMGTALALMNETDAEWNSSDMIMKERIQKTLPEHVRKIVDKCNAEGITEKLKSTKSVDESFDLAKRVFEMIYEQSADEHIKKLKEQQEKDGKSGDKEGKSSGEGKKNGKSSSGKEGDGKEKAKRMQEMYAKYLPQPLIESVADPDGGGLHLDYTDYDKTSFRKFKPVSWEETILYCMKTNRDLGGVPLRTHSYASLRTGSSAPWVSQYKDDANAKTLANKIRRFLQVKSSATYIGNQQRGKIHSKTLYRVACPRFGDGSWNARVFKTKKENDVLDVAVTVLVDYSGSMSGQKVRDAIKSSMILTECLAHGLRVPVEILGFTELSHDLTMFLIKGFDDRPSMEQVGLRMIPPMGCMSENNDGDAIMLAYHRLRRRKEKRKMLFVLSDGSPASGRGDAMDYTKKIVKSIEEEGIVDIYGVGIQDRNVDLIYKKKEVLGNSSELEDKLLKIVQRRIINEEVR
jgi:cobalamin biosynthesis protein CobT